MAPLLYYLLLKPLSLLPLSWLHRLSDGLYVLLYHGLGYRRSVVRSNLARSFPQKSSAARQQLERQFYRHLCDVMVETVKAFSISEEALLRRSKLRNPELLRPYFEQGRSLMVAAGHYNNWEIAAVATPLQIPHEMFGAYMPLKSSFFDRLIRETRGRFGLGLIPIQQLKGWFSDCDGPPRAMLFATDQCPRHVHKAYWTTSLQQETAVMMGTEKYAQQHDLPVVFGRVYKVRRGYYEFEFEVITDQPRATEPGAITEAHTRLLEQEILAAPQYWLWTHKRWKRQRPEAQAPAEAKN